MNNDELEVKCNNLEERIARLEQNSVQKVAAESLEVGDRVVLTKPINNIMSRVIRENETLIADSAKEDVEEELGNFELDLDEIFTDEAYPMSINKVTADTVELTDVDHEAWSAVLKESIFVRNIIVPREFVKKI